MPRMERADRDGIVLLTLTDDFTPERISEFKAHILQALSEGQARMIMRLLKQVRAGLPPQTRVLVLADRGIGTSPLLMRGIAALGWTFLFRVTKQSKIVLSDFMWPACFPSNQFREPWGFKSIGAVGAPPKPY